MRESTVWKLHCDQEPQGVAAAQLISEQAEQLDSYDVDGRKHQILA